MIMRRMNITGLLLLLTLIPFYIPDLSAQTLISSERETLRGLKGFYVLIIDDIGLESILKTAVELKFRKAGIRVLTIDELAFMPGEPYLWIIVRAINTIKLKSPQISFSGFFYSVTVEFKQDVTLSRNHFIKTSGVTWTDSILGTTPETNAWRNIREAVSFLVDEFMNDYLAVNPK